MSDQVDTKPALKQFTRPMIGQLQRELLKAPKTWFGPEVWLLTEPDGSRCVLKDYAHCPWPVRSTWGRYLVAREKKAHLALSGIPCFPELVAELDCYAFAIEYIEGEALPRRRQVSLLKDGFFAELASALKQMHDRGVAHGDVRRNNIMRRSCGSPALIDFQSATFDGRNPLRHWFFQYMVRVDALTVLKLQTKYYPGRATPNDRQQLENLPTLLRIGRFLRQHIYPFLMLRKRPKRKKRRKH